MQENEYEGLDEMFKSGLENSRISPPPGVWEGVAASVAGTGAGVGAGIGIFGKVILGVAVSAGLGVGAYFYVQSQNEQPQLPKEGNKQEQVIAPADQKLQVENGLVRTEEPANKTQFVVPAPPPQSLFDREDPTFTADGSDNVLWKENEKQVDAPYSPGGPTVDPKSQINPCAHQASISSSKLADNQYRFTLSAPGNASNITWYVNGVAEYAGEANSRTLDRTFSDAEESTFAVKARIRTGNCWDSAVQQIKVVIPEKPKAPSKFSMPYNAFTPNNDGLNDDLFVEIENQDYFELNVFDKNNNQMFRSNTPDLRWTGKCGVNDCPVGTYVAVVKYRFKGESEYRYKRVSIYLTR